ncbi:MAG: hypothetical protein ABSF80_08605 [Chitinispirillaceae bacterium]
MSCRRIKTPAPPSLNLAYTALRMAGRFLALARSAALNLPIADAFERFPGQAISPRSFAA